MMIRYIFLSFVLVFGWIGFVQYVVVYCQILCGIYGDKCQFDEMCEYVCIIEKFMEEIICFSGVIFLDIYFISCWIVNKEVYVQKI